MLGFVPHPNLRADCPFNTGNHGTCFLDVSEEGKIKKIAGKFAFGVGNFTKAG